MAATVATMPVIKPLCDADLQQAPESVWDRLKGDFEISDPKRSSASVIEGHLSVAAKRKRAVWSSSEPKHEREVLDVVDGNGILAEDDIVDDDISSAYSEALSNVEEQRLEVQRRRSESDAADMPPESVVALLALRDSNSLDKGSVEKVRRSALLPKNRPKHNRTVRWHYVELREYGRTMGDNPSVSHGIPVGLKWEYQKFRPVDLDDFEEMRMDFRRYHSEFAWTGRLTAQERLEICINDGFTIDAMEACLDEVIQLKRQQEENWQDLVDEDEDGYSCDDSTDDGEEAMAGDQGESGPNVNVQTVITGVGSGFKGAAKAVGRVAAGARRATWSFRKMFRRRSKRSSMDKAGRHEWRGSAPVEKYERSSSMSTSETGRTERADSGTSLDSADTGVSWAHEDITESDLDEDSVTVPQVLAPIDETVRYSGGPRKYGPGIGRFLENDSEEAEDLASKQRTSGGAVESESEAEFDFADVGMNAGGVLVDEDHGDAVGALAKRSSDRSVADKRSSLRRIGAAISSAVPSLGKQEAERKKSGNDMVVPPGALAGDPLDKRFSWESDASNSPVYDNPMLLPEEEVYDDDELRDLKTRGRRRSPSGRLPPSPDPMLMTLPKESGFV